jgi:hypothetical protein
VVPDAEIILAGFSSDAVELFLKFSGSFARWRRLPFNCGPSNAAAIIRVQATKFQLHGPWVATRTRISRIECFDTQSV